MCILFYLFCFFFFKQKTAYEMRISDWSSDVCSSDLYARHRSHGFARVTYVNWLATTETGVVAYNVFPPHSELPVGVVPAGRARDGKDVQIVDVNGVPLPDGEIGEIQVVSSDLADGYHGDPDRTATRFTRLGDGVSIYRTGDRARIDERGE